MSRHPAEMTWERKEIVNLVGLKQPASTDAPRSDAMAEQPETAAEESSAKAKGRLRLMLFAAGGLLLLTAAGAGAAWYFGLFGSDEVTAAEHGSDERKEAPTAEAEADAHGEEGKASDGDPKSDPLKIAFLELPDILVNLQTQEKRMRYLKLALALEVRDPAQVEKLRGLTPRIMDSIQLYLRTLSVDDVEGAVGMETLKQEMTARINRAVAPMRVNGVLVKEMLVQ